MFLEKFIIFLGVLMPVLDKGHQITSFCQELDISRFKNYCSQRRKNSLFQVPFEGFSDVDLAFYERLFLRRKNNLRSLSKRIEKCVEHYHYSNCYFITLTFDDLHLNRTSAEYRRSYVSKFLKRHFLNYVANIDFGSENEREHYHAIVFTDHDLVCERFNEKFVYPEINDYSMGFYSIKPVFNAFSDRAALSKYMIKLKFHSSKDSTQFQKPIYSRKDVCYE